MLPDMAHKTPQTVRVRRRGELLDQLAVLREQTDIQTFATQIQSSMQHCDRASSRLVLGDKRSLPPRRPSFIAFQNDRDRGRSSHARCHTWLLHKAVCEN